MSQSADYTSLIRPTALLNSSRKCARVSALTRLCAKARAKIRVMVRRILNTYGDPPDLQEEAGSKEKKGAWLWRVT